MPLLVLADHGAEPADEHERQQREAGQERPRPAAQSLRQRDRAQHQREQRDRADDRPVAARAGRSTCWRRACRACAMVIDLLVLSSASATARGLVVESVGERDAVDVARQRRIDDEAHRHRRAASFTAKCCGVKQKHSVLWK